MAKAKQQQKAVEARKTLSTTIRDYIQSLKYEWVKITFPTRKELTQSTVVVFLFTVVLMLIISLYDALMSIVFNKFLLPPIATGGA